MSWPVRISSVLMTMALWGAELPALAKTSMPLAKGRLIGCRGSVCEFLIGTRPDRSKLDRLAENGQLRYSHAGLQVFDVETIAKLSVRKFGGRNLWTMQCEGRWLVDNRTRRDLLDQQAKLALINTAHDEDPTSPSGVTSERRANGTILVSERGNAAETGRLSRAPRNEASISDTADVRPQIAASATRNVRAARVSDTGSDESVTTPARPRARSTPAEGQSAFERFSAWARGDTSPEARLAALIFKAGSPLSPTSLYGASLEFYPSTVMPVSIGFGEYESRSFTNHERGRVHYSNTSIGSGVLIGRPQAQLALGASLVHISAKHTAAEMYKDGSIVKSMRTSYRGIVPSLGMRFSSDSDVILTTELGTFVPVGGKAAFEDPGAPLTQRDDWVGYRNPRATFNLGLGFGF